MNHPCKGIGIILLGLILSVLGLVIGNEIAKTLGTSVKILGDTVAILGTLAFLYGFLFLVKEALCNSCRLNKVKKFLDEKTKELITRQIHWSMHEEGRYLHLCVKYPQFYNPKGMLDMTQYR